MKIHLGYRLCILAVSTFLFAGCDSVDDERIPNYAVYINLSNQGIWNTYGVSGFGSHRNFIFNPQGVSQPSGFTYVSGSATGFGGVLLIEGMDPLNLESAAPLAYDLACPVERDPKIRVYIDDADYVAVCSQCHSIYNVTMGAGAPIGGEAANGKYRYSLKRYAVVPATTGGYYIKN